MGQYAILASRLVGAVKALWSIAPWYAKGAILMGASYGLNRYTMAQAENAGSGLGQEVTAQGGTLPVFVGYGETTSPGSLLFIGVDNRNDDDVYDLHYLLAHSWRANGGIESVEGFYLNDDYIVNRFSSTDTSAPIGTHGIQDGGAWDVDTGLTKAVYVKANRGSQRVDMEAGGGPFSQRQHLLGETFRQWRNGVAPDATMIGAARDCATTHWRFRLHKDSQDLFSAGPPRIRALLKWSKVYDPRLDTTRDGGAGAHRFDTPTTWQWTDNPALAWADYRTQYCGTPESRIDWAGVIEAANFCDELVPIPTGGMEKRYRCDLRLSGGDKHKHNLGAILDTFNAQQTYASGRYGLVIPKARAAAYSFTADNVIGQVGLATDRPRQEEVTRVSTKIRSRDNLHQEYDAPTRESTSLRGDDREHRDVTVALPGVSRHTQAQRLANGLLQQQRMHERIVCPLNWEALEMQVGERFELTYEELNYTSPKKFRVVDLELGGSEAPVTAYAIEDDDTVWDDLLEIDYHTIDASEKITRAVGLPNAPGNFTAAPTANTGEILWRWTLPGLYDTIILYTSATQDFDDATATWEGNASEFLQTGLLGNEAERTRYGWLRSVKSGRESLRNPDDDISSVSAVASADVDGDGSERIYALFPSAVFQEDGSLDIPESQLPLNSWPFEYLSTDENGPVTLDGVTWRDGPPLPVKGLEFRIRAERVVPGTPAPGAEPDDTWGDWILDVDLSLPDGVPGRSGIGERFQYHGRATAIMTNPVQRFGGYELVPAPPSDAQTDRTSTLAWSHYESLTHVRLTVNDDEQFWRGPYYANRVKRGDLLTIIVKAWDINAGGGSPTTPWPHDQWVDYRISGPPTFHTEDFAGTSTDDWVEFPVQYRESSAPEDPPPIPRGAAIDVLFSRVQPPLSVSSNGPLINEAGTVRAEWVRGDLLEQWVEVDFVAPNQKRYISIADVRISDRAQINQLSRSVYTVPGKRTITFEYDRSVYEIVAQADGAVRPGKPGSTLRASYGAYAATPAANGAYGMYVNGRQQTVGFETQQKAGELALFHNDADGVDHADFLTEMGPRASAVLEVAPEKWVSFRIGRAYAKPTYAVAITGGTEEGRNEIHFDPATGLLTGHPEAGTYSVTLTATHRGLTATRQFDLVVEQLAPTMGEATASAVSLQLGGQAVLKIQEFFEGRGIMLSATSSDTGVATATVYESGGATWLRIAALSTYTPSAEGAWTLSATITITASNAGGSTSRQVGVTVSGVYDDGDDSNN